jgi:hypothetical protein
MYKSHRPFAVFFPLPVTHLAFERIPVTGVFSVLARIYTKGVTMLLAAMIKLELDFLCSVFDKR